METIHKLLSKCIERGPLGVTEIFHAWKSRFFRDLFFFSFLNSATSCYLAKIKRKANEREREKFEKRVTTLERSSSYIKWTLSHAHNWTVSFRVQITNKYEVYFDVDDSCFVSKVTLLPGCYSQRHTRTRFGTRVRLFAISLGIHKKNREWEIFLFFFFALLFGSQYFLNTSMSGGVVSQMWLYCVFTTIFLDSKIEIRHGIPWWKLHDFQLFA